MPNSDRLNRHPQRLQTDMNNQPLPPPPAPSQEWVDKKAADFLAWGRGSWGQGPYDQARYDNGTMLRIWTSITDKAKAHAEFLSDKNPNETN